MSYRMSYIKILSMVLFCFKILTGFERPTNIKLKNECIHNFYGYFITETYAKKNKSKIFTSQQKENLNLDFDLSPKFKCCWFGFFLFSPILQTKCASGERIQSEFIKRKKV